MSNPTIPVRFLAKCPPYNAGEVAGFPPAKAAEFIRDGLAERYGLEKVTEKPKPKPRRKTRSRAKKEL